MRKNHHLVGPTIHQIPIKVTKLLFTGDFPIKFPFSSGISQRKPRCPFHPYQPPQELADQFHDSVDTNGSGEISLQEFYTSLAPYVEIQVEMGFTHIIPYISIYTICGWDALFGFTRV